MAHTLIQENDMNSTRAHIRDFITAAVLMAFLAAMAPGIDRSLSQIGSSIQSIQSIQANAGGAL